MRLAAILLLVASATTLAAPAPFPKPPKPVPAAPTGPFEIDFTPLAACFPEPGNWRVTIDVTCPSKQIFLIDGRCAPSMQWALLNLLQQRHQDVETSRDHPNGWKLLVTPRKGVQGIHVEVSTYGLDPAIKPLVRRLPK